MLSLFILSFLITQWSVLRGWQMTQQTISQEFFAWRWVLCLGMGSAPGCGICTSGWDLCLGMGSLLFISMDFSMAISSMSRFSSFKDWCEVSLFASLIVQLFVESLFSLS